MKKNPILNAPVVVGKKEELFRQFKAVLYANTEAIFDEEDNKFVEMCGEVTIKDDDCLSDYYIRN